MSQKESELSIKFSELKLLNESHQKLIDKHTSLKVQQLEKEKVLM